MAIKVRHAASEDVDWIVSELKKFSEFYGTQRELFLNEENSKPLVQMWVSEHLVLVAERESQLLGFIAGLVHPHLYNPEIQVLSELFWWVPEEYRNTRAGALLLNEYMMWGKKNTNWITMTLEHNSPVNEKSLFKRGFKLVEKSYLLEV